MMHTLVQWLLDTIGAMGYPGIFLLMAMESSIIPVPSELVMPPAGYLAYQGKMNMAVAILCGTAGSLVGAYANYFASHYLGRPLILKYGKYVLIPPDKFERVERFLSAARRDIDLYRPSPAGDPPSDLDPGRCGRDESPQVLAVHAAGRRHLVHHPDIDRLCHRREPAADHAVFT